MVSTMSEMELKASELQQKLSKKMELSNSNAEIGIKRIALEYKVEELNMKLLFPPGFDPDVESDDDEHDTNKHGSGLGYVPNQVAQVQAHSLF
jgi:hypothetical protein